MLGPVVPAAAVAVVLAAVVEVLAVGSRSAREPAGSLELAGTPPGVEFADSHPVEPLANNGSSSLHPQIQKGLACETTCSVLLLWRTRSRGRGLITSRLIQISVFDNLYHVL